MKTMKFFAAAAAMALAMGAQGAWAADTATANVSVTVVTPMTITNTSGLNFGSLVKPTSTATLQLNANDASRTPSGGLALVTGVTPTAAAFDVTGSGNLAYSAQVSWDSATDAVGTGLTLSAVTAQCGGRSEAAVTNGAGFTCTESSGVDVLKLGGTLAIDGAQAVATTTAAGFITATVAYN